MKSLLSLTLLLAMLLSVFGGTIEEVNRLTVTYPVNNCDAFPGNSGKRVACSALASTAVLPRDEVTCVLEQSSCGSNVRRRNLLQANPTLTVVLDVSEDVVDNATLALRGEAAADSPASFRTNVILEWRDAGNEPRAEDAENTTFDDGDSTVETVDRPEDECETNVDCADDPYGRTLCLVGTPEAPIVNECVECLVNADCEQGEFCNDLNVCQLPPSL